ncbi:hypothetical protein Tco_0449592, partial [Tanacetum coccineum]
TDYDLLEVIVNGESPPPKITVDGVEQTYPTTTVDEKLAMKNELKATPLMALPNEHQVVGSHVFDGQENERYKTSKGYHAAPPSYTGNFMPPKYDLVHANEGEYVFSESVTSMPDVASREAKTSVSKPKSVGEPLIEDWISDSEDENETKFKSKQRKPSFAKTEFIKSNEHVKTPKESVKKVENKRQAKYPRKNSQSPRGN